MDYNNTDEWRLYENGRDYNNKLGYYAKTDLNYRMYNNDQWVGVVTNGLPKYTFNICKSAINYFISFICSQKVKMQYSAQNIPDEPTEPQQILIKDFTKLMSDAADLKWEKDKMDFMLRELLIDCACAGDMAVHVYWNPKIKTGQLEQGDFETEMVDGVNIMFGNPNNRKAESQPYILIVGRELTSKLKNEAKENKVEQYLIDSIMPDEENTYQAGKFGKVELDNKSDNTGKTLYVIKYWKENDTVYWSKSTKNCQIVKKVDLGISRYPVAWANWEAIKNCYHGNPVIEGMIDNQIGINQLFAMVAYWMKKMAFGSVIYDSTRITDFSNKLGQAFKANGPVGGSQGEIIKQLEAGNFNAAILQVIDMAIKYTKEFIGANDTLLGQVNPEQASGTAIISTAKQASMPLGNIQAARDQFVEDLGLIWGEFMLKKYKNRQLPYKQDGNVMMADFSTENMGDILLQCNVDVGPSTYWSEVAGLQSLDNLLKSGQINKLQYFERIAKMNIIPDVQGLIKDAQDELDPNKMLEDFVSKLSPELQQAIAQESQAMIGGGTGGMQGMPQGISNSQQ